MNKIYCISDIHGCYEKLENLLNKISLQEEDEFVFLGDYIDRGPESKKVLDLLLSIKSKFKSTFLLGNHEQMFLDFLKRPKMDDLFLYNGGYKTLENFEKINENGEGIWDVGDKYIDFLTSMKLWYETEDYFFVHAGVPDIDLEEITEKNKETLLWVRDSFLESEYMWGKTIIHGHTPIKEIDIYGEKINIDTGCVYGGELSCLILPELDIIKV